MSKRATQKKTLTYGVQSDENNFKLVHRYINQNGKEAEEITGFFSTLDSLRAYAVRHLLRIGDGSLEVYEDAEAKFNELFSHHTREGEDVESMRRRLTEALAFFKVKLTKKGHEKVYNVK